MNAPARRGRPPRQHAPSLQEAVQQIQSDDYAANQAQMSRNPSEEEMIANARATQEAQRGLLDVRPDMRAPMREEDPRARAAKRAAELRNHGSLDEGIDKFAIPLEDIPAGWEYEWKRKTLLGKEDPTYDTHLARTGWEPVPTSRHPSYMPSNGKYPIIEREGMVLMERPKEISDEARGIERRRARDQIRAKEEQLGAAPPGTFERDHPSTRPSIKHSYEPMPIPD